MAWKLNAEAQNSKGTGSQPLLLSKVPLEMLLETRAVQSMAPENNSQLCDSQDCKRNHRHLREVIRLTVVWCWLKITSGRLASNGFRFVNSTSVGTGDARASRAGACEARRQMLSTYVNLPFLPVNCRSFVGLRWSWWRSCILPAMTSYTMQGLSKADI